MHKGGEVEDWKLVFIYIVFPKACEHLIDNKAHFNWDNVFMEEEKISWSKWQGDIDVRRSESNSIIYNIFINDIAFDIVRYFLGVANNVT